MSDLAILEQLEATLTNELGLTLHDTAKGIGYSYNLNPQMKVDKLYFADNIIVLSPIIRFLEQLSELRQLTIRFSKLDNVEDLVRLPQLVVLDLFSNKITDTTPLKQLTRLQYLNLSSNPIHNFSGLGFSTGMKQLNLRNTNFKDPAILAELRELTTMNLSGNGLANALGKLSLPALTNLFYEENALDDISSLTHLTNLRLLKLNDNEIEDIQGIGMLQSLRELNLSRNKIVDIGPLADCSDITILYLNNNRIENIEAISRLKKLRNLALGNNRIVDIRPLSGVRYMERIHLYNNRIDDISCLEDLQYLVELSLQSNGIKDIMALSRLKRLQNINLSQNKIEELPLHLLNLNIPIGFEPELRERSINLYGNPLTAPPVEIVRLGTDAIRTWAAEDKVYINEVKVLLVGHGEVGKTTLVKSLMDEPPDPHEPATDHIRINTLTIEYKEKGVKLNFWDFGGQEVMHSTHQFFLSTRSVYLLLLDGRRDEDAEYWLKHIESFGGRSPVLIILNKIDTNPSFDVDRRFLQQKYPFIKGFYRTACLKEIKGIHELMAGLQSVLDEVEILTTPWPRNWLAVKTQLENMPDNFISQSRYDSLCTYNKIKDGTPKEVLTEYLNDLGVIVHFKDLRLSNLHILQPRWVSRAAYKIISSKKISENNGIFKAQWLSAIMKRSDEDDFDYHADIFPYMLDLMQKFELCYSLSDKHEFLIPELLAIQQPLLPEHTGPVLKFFLKFEDLLPRSIMARFIVRMHEDILQDLRWRTGVVLNVPIFNSLAIVIADTKEKRINISVSGSRRREHFAIIRKTFHSLKDSFQRLVMTEWIPLPDFEDHAVEYDELIGHEDAEEETIFIGKLKRRYRIADLLNGIEPESVRKQEFQWDVFLCHSSRDKEIIHKIAADMQKKGIKYWLDEEHIKPGDSIIDTITDGLQRSRTIMPCLSSNQITANWSRKEYQSILSKFISGATKQKIIPLLLEEIAQENIPLFLSDLRRERYSKKDEYEKLLDFLTKSP